MKETDIIIVGAGIIGLAIAAALSRNDRNIIVVEKEKSFGQGASSRNSEIIHSGIYYSKNSLKAKLCTEGRELLYQFCQEHNIPHKKKGKLIVATNNEEKKELEELIEKGRANGLTDLKLLDKTKIEEIEPNINAIFAIYSPSTGIVDTHQLMRKLSYLSEKRGVVFAYSCEVRGVENKKGKYNVSVCDSDGEELILSTRILINSAGLYSDKIANMAGIDIAKYKYELHHSKGEYFRIRQSKAKLLKASLIYPTPKAASLGIHTVEDIQGQVKLGPNAFYIKDVNYDVDPSHRGEFYDAVKIFLPFIECGDLTPDMSGIRAKLQAKGEAERDFVISDEKNKGFPGLINLIGIESPGLTASLAIAKYVGNMV